VLRIVRREGTEGERRRMRNEHKEGGREGRGKGGG
jgi:hypothetical protein